MGSGAREAFEVFLDAADLGGLRRIGTLFRSGERTDLPASFAYDRAWRESGQAFMLDPRLDLWDGEQHPPAPSAAFGIFMDSAPDRWGRVLMERREAAAAMRENRKVRTLQELDFLLGVHDIARMGALRFRRADGPFLDDSANAAPPVASLKELAYISRRIEESGVESLPGYEQWLATLVVPGSSLGGARPKASFTEGTGGLWIAKFPACNDRYDVGGWEYLAHQLAASARIDVPPARPEYFTEAHTTFCAARFDRLGDRRRMFASAMTLLERVDGATDASYLDIAEFISDHGARGQIDADLKQLFRRVVFNVLVGNRDDHLRNHGFLRDPRGWRLAPAFDVNPNPGKAEHALTLDGATAAPDLAAVRKTAPLYRLADGEAKAIIEETSTAVGDWRTVAARQGLPRIEIRRFEGVFMV